MRLGDVTIEGTLFARFKLADVRASFLCEPLYLEHALRHEIDGTPVSWWHVPGLETHLVRERGNLVRVQLPGGATARFSGFVSPVVFRPDERQVYSIRGRTSDRDSLLEVRAPSGVVYEYTDGELTGIISASQSRVEVSSRGGRIHEIHNAGQRVLHATYNEAGGIATLRIPDAEYEFAYDRTGTLGRVLGRGAAAGCAFEYDAGLLRTIIDPKGRSTLVDWRRNPRFAVGTSLRSNVAVYVARVGADEYRIRHPLNAVVLERMVDGRTVETLTFNVISGAIVKTP